jgi:hypothetical protein
VSSIERKKGMCGWWVMKGKGWRGRIIMVSIDLGVDDGNGSDQGSAYPV